MLRLRTLPAARLTIIRIQRVSRVSTRGCFLSATTRNLELNAENRATTAKLNTGLSSRAWSVKIFSAGVVFGLVGGAGLLYWKYQAVMKKGIEKVQKGKEKATAVAGRLQEKFKEKRSKHEVKEEKAGKDQFDVNSGDAQEERPQFLVRRKIKRNQDVSKEKGSPLI